MYARAPFRKDLRVHEIRKKEAMGKGGVGSKITRKYSKFKKYKFKTNVRKINRN